MKFSIQKAVLLSLYYFFCLPSYAYAYLDPGTGSALFSIILAFVSTLFFTSRQVYQRILSWFYKLWGKSKQNINLKYDIVFYSEGKQYWNVFKPIIQEFIQKEVKITYLSSDEKDPGLTQKSAYLDQAFIGKGNKAFTQLNLLEANICIMTTPGLGVGQIQRSKGVSHYVHLVHSPADMCLYKLYSFDYFDSIMCSGSYQKKTIRALEKKRGTAKKICFDTGCTYMDILLEQKKTANKEKESNTKKLKILIAPSWGKNGLLKRFEDQIIKYVLAEDFAVVLRPHPQSMIEEKTLINKILDTHEKNPNFSLDLSKDPCQSLNWADLMISDLSGIVFDCAFVFEKPVITIDIPLDLSGTEGIDLPSDYPIWESSVIDQITKNIKADEIKKIPSYIREILKENKYKDKIRSLRDKNIYNFGQAGKVAAQQVIDVRKEIIQSEEEKIKTDIKSESYST